MGGGFLEEIGAVKTARREAESILLAKTALKQQPIIKTYHDRILNLARNNKVLLRTASLLKTPDSILREASSESQDAFLLYDLMSKTLDSRGISFVVIKSFDSLPDIGHDLDFLVPVPEEFDRAKQLLLREFRVRTQSLTHCDKLLGKFSCFLPGYKHDFELYPTISQLGEEHLDPSIVMQGRRTELIEGREVWVTSDMDGVLIRVVHAMFRHNSLKLSDILDFLNLIPRSPKKELLEKADSAGIGDALVFFLATVERFLKACDYHSPPFDLLIKDSEKRWGPRRLRWLQRDRLVLPYRIPAAAIMILFLLKAGRDASRGRFKSAALCLTTPPLIVLDFLNSVFNHRLFRRRIW